MRRTILVLAVLVAGASWLGVGTTLAFAKTWGAEGPQASAAAARQAGKAIELRGITGKVVAVDPDTKTLVVKGSVVGDPKDETVSATVTDTSSIRHGWFHRNLSDLKVGEQVRMVYQGTDHRWVADSVRILNPLVGVKGTEGPDIRSWVNLWPPAHEHGGCRLRIRAHTPPSHGSGGFSLLFLRPAISPA